MKRPPCGHFGVTAPDFSTAKLEIDDWLYQQVGGVVQSGPFSGMVMSREVSWQDTRLSPMLLGCYEEELHGILAQQIERLQRIERTPKIVVVGCAEGYYAIGLKRCVTRAEVHAIDKDNTALEILKKSAHLNSVEIKIGASLDEVFDSPDLIVMDCEGAEVLYLDRTRFRGLVGANIIVEVHNLEGQQTDNILLERFKGTHQIDMLIEGPRNPNKFKELCGMTADYRWMAVNENRPCLMAWYNMTPRGMALT